MVFLLAMVMVMFGADASASPFSVPLDSTVFRTLSYPQQKLVVETLMRTMVDLEEAQLAYQRLPASPQKTTGLRQLRELREGLVRLLERGTIDRAHAGTYNYCPRRADQGAADGNCLWGGWASSFKNGVCKRPGCMEDEGARAFFDSIQRSCPRGRTPCNTRIFGLSTASGPAPICINPDQVGDQNASLACLIEFERLPDREARLAAIIAALQNDENARREFDITMGTILNTCVCTTTAENAIRRQLNPRYVDYMRNHRTCYALVGQLKHLVDGLKGDPAKACQLTVTTPEMLDGLSETLASIDNYTRRLVALGANASMDNYAAVLARHRARSVSALDDQAELRAAFATEPGWCPVVPPQRQRAPTAPPPPPPVVAPPPAAPATDEVTELEEVVVVAPRREVLIPAPVTQVTDLVTTVPAVTIDEPEDDSEEDETLECYIEEDPVGDTSNNRFIYTVSASGDVPAPANVTWGDLITGATRFEATPATPAAAAPAAAAPAAAAPAAAAPAAAAPAAAAPATDTTTTITVTYPAGTASTSRRMSASYTVDDKEVACSYQGPTAAAPVEPATPTPATPVCTIAATVEGAGATKGKVSVKLTITPPTGRSGHTRVTWDGITAPRAGSEDLLVRVFETAPATDKKFTATLHYPSGTPREVSCTMDKGLDIAPPPSPVTGAPAGTPMPTWDWDPGLRLYEGVE